LPALPAFSGADYLQFVLSGITLGRIYSLIALGFHILYRENRVLNFAIGEQVVLGGLVALVLVLAHVPTVLAYLLAIAFSGLVGWSMEKIAVRPAYRSGELATLIVTVGLLLVIRHSQQQVFGTNTRSFPSFTGDLPFSLLTPLFSAGTGGFHRATGAALDPITLWVVLLSIVSVAGVQWFFQRTLFGKAMRAAADNPVASQVVGVTE